MRLRRITAGRARGRGSEGRRGRLFLLVTVPSRGAGYAIFILIYSVKSGRGAY